MQLDVVKFAGILGQDEDTRLLGDALPLDQLPRRSTRRLTRLERGVVACLMGLDQACPNGLGDTTCVLASRYGPMNHTLSLLDGLLEGDLLSPTAFSLSVHNAALGAASQIISNHGGHTAVSAGEETLLAGLNECWSRLSDGLEQIVLVYSDLRLPDAYGAFDSAQLDVQFACLLRPGSDNRTSVTAHPGGNASRSLLEAFADGVKQVEWAL